MAPSRAAGILMDEISAICNSEVVLGIINKLVTCFCATSYAWGGVIKLYSVVKQSMLSI